MKWLRAQWDRFQEWRFERQVTKLVLLGAEAVVSEVAVRLQRELTEDEIKELRLSFWAWLEKTDERALAFLSRPMRTVHLFVSEVTDLAVD